MLHMAGGRELRLEGRVEANGHISQCDAVHTCSSNGTRRDLPRVPDVVKEGKKFELCSLRCCVDLPWCSPKNVQYGPRPKGSV